MSPFIIMFVSVDIIKSPVPFKLFIDTCPFVFNHNAVPFDKFKSPVKLEKFVGVISALFFKLRFFILVS